MPTPCNGGEPRLEGSSLVAHPGAHAVNAAYLAPADPEDLWCAGLVDDPVRSLKAEPYWGTWRAVVNGTGKPDKVPTPKRNEPWLPFEDAMLADRSQRAGLGFNVLQAGRNAIDLDHCVDASGDVDERAKELIRQCDGAYVELSPSGTGLKVIGGHSPSPRFMQVDFSKSPAAVGTINNYTAITFRGEGNPDTDITEVIDVWMAQAPTKAGRYEPTAAPDSRHLELFKMLRSEKARKRTWSVALAACLAHNEEFAEPLPEGELRPYLERSWHEADRLATAPADFRRGKGEAIVPGDLDNIRLAIANMGIRMSQNDFTEQKLVTREGHTQPLSDDVHNAIWIDINDRFRFNPPDHVLRKLLEGEAAKNAFHPVRDYLAGLAWDGTARIDQWLARYGGLRTRSTCGQSARWFWSRPSGVSESRARSSTRCSYWRAARASARATRLPRCAPTLGGSRTTFR